MTEINNGAKTEQQHHSTDTNIDNIMTVGVARGCVNVSNEIELKFSFLCYAIW